MKCSLQASLYVSLLNVMMLMMMQSPRFICCGSENKIIKKKKFHLLLMSALADPSTSLRRLTQLTKGITLRHKSHSGHSLFIICAQHVNLKPFHHRELISKTSAKCCPFFLAPATLDGIQWKLRWKHFHLNSVKMRKERDSDVVDG